jgi:predicted GIY-YIG superfamily endonuclease
MENKEINLLDILEKFADSNDNKINGNIPAVYMLDNEETNKYYIGATSKKDNRYKSHVFNLKNNTHVNYKLQEVYNENSNFKLKEIPVDNSNLAFKIEKELIINSRKDPNCLNIKDCVPYTEECRKNMSLAQLERFKDPIERQKLSLIKQGKDNSFYGKQHSEETKEKLRVSGKKLWLNPEFKNKQIEDGIKRWEDSNFRNHQIQIQTQIWSNPELREHVRKKGLERYENEPERKEKQRQVVIELMKNPEARRKSSEGAIKQWENPEFKAKICKRISIDGNEYESIKTASDLLGIIYTTLYSRINSTNFPTYFYL